MAYVSTLSHMYLFLYIYYTGCFFLCAQTSTIGKTPPNKSIFKSGKIPKTASFRTYKDFEGNFKFLNFLKFRNLQLHRDVFFVRCSLVGYQHQLDIKPLYCLVFDLY